MLAANFSSERGTDMCSVPVARSLLSEGRTTREVSDVTGYSPGWVRQIARRYNERGVEGLGDRRHNGREGIG